jgi:hypothetical protein
MALFRKKLLSDILLVYRKGLFSLHSVTLQSPNLGLSDDLFRCAAGITLALDASLLSHRRYQ